MGAAAGLFVAYWATRALATMTTVLPVDNDLRIDGRLVVFTLALGVLSTVLFALAPALQAAGRRPADALARGGRAQAGGRHLLQRCLVGVQVGLALVLLVGAGLLMRSFARLQAIDPGLVAENVVTFRMTASWSERLEAVEQRQARTVARLEEIPGVRAAAFTQLLPIDGDYPPQEFFITGRDPGEKTFAHGRMVSAGYFRTLGIPMLEGGTCDAMPTRPSRRKAIVSESFVKRFFANDTALGRHLRTVSMPAGETMEIVGIVRDVRERGITKAPEPILYHCGFNGYWPDMFYMASLDPSRPAGIPALRAALGEIEPSRAMYSIRPLTEVIRESMAQARFNTTLLALFAATALGLAAMGLYGVLSQLVAARRREIGVRLALGAAPARIVRSVAAQAATVTAAGIVAGSARRRGCGTVHERAGLRRADARSADLRARAGAARDCCGGCRLDTGAPRRPRRSCRDTAGVSRAGARVRSAPTLLLGVGSDPGLTPASRSVHRPQEAVHCPPGDGPAVFRSDFDSLAEVNADEDPDTAFSSAAWENDLNARIVGDGSAQVSPAGSV